MAWLDVVRDGGEADDSCTMRQAWALSWACAWSIDRVDAASYSRIPLAGFHDYTHPCFSVSCLAKDDVSTCVQSL